MDTGQVVAHLQQQFAGQLVLYVADMAKILGKSEKAISGLIARDGLPFKVKTLGGLRCVDVFQVAQWLVSSEGVVSEVLTSPALSVPSAASRKRQSPDASSKTLLPSMALQVLSMRHDHVEALQRMVFGLRDVEELLFMQEVVESLADARLGLSPRYVVNIRTVRMSRSAIRSHTRSTKFATESAADNYLMVCLERFKHKEPTRLVHVTFEDDSVVKFHCIIRGGSWRVPVNDIGLELNGL